MHCMQDKWKLNPDLLYECNNDIWHSIYSWWLLVFEANFLNSQSEIYSTLWAFAYCLLQASSDWRWLCRRWGIGSLTVRENYENLRKITSNRNVPIRWPSSGMIAFVLNTVNRVWLVWLRAWRLSLHSDREESPSMPLTTPSNMAARRWPPSTKQTSCEFCAWRYRCFDCWVKEWESLVQWNLVITRSDITKSSYNEVILLVPALYISLFFYPDIMRNLI